MEKIGRKERFLSAHHEMESEIVGLTRLVGQQFL